MISKILCRLPHWYRLRLKVFFDDPRNLSRRRLNLLAPQFKDNRDGLLLTADVSEAIAPNRGVPADFECAAAGYF